MQLSKSPREWIAVTASALGAGGAWGAIAAASAKALIGLTEEASLLFVGVPVGTLVILWLWPKLPKILGFRQDS